jgi:hypothetical protein
MTIIFNNICLRMNYKGVVQLNCEFEKQVKKCLGIKAAAIAANNLTRISHLISKIN